MANGKSHGLFNLTGNLHPKRSTFDLSYSKKFDATFGALYPVMCDEVIPGDTFHIGNQIVCRVVNPLMAPVMQSWKIYTHYFFVPYRILWDKWEEFISGGVTGDSVIPVPVDSTYAYRGSTGGGVVHFNDINTNNYKEFYRARSSFGSLADFLYGVAFPEDDETVIPLDDCPTVFPKLAYYHVWNDYYRDENLQNPYGMGLTSGSDPQYVSGNSYQGQLTTISPAAGGDFVHYAQNSKGLLWRSWKKDYFTSALQNQQRGTPPTLQFSFNGSAIVKPGTSVSTAAPQNLKVSHTYGESTIDFSTSSVNPSYSDGSLYAIFSNTPVDTGITVSDLRFVTQVQKWQERNMRGGVRYTEFLQAHFGICPRDDRMMRPEYLGGSVQPIVVSEVLQTSPSDAEGVETSLGRLGGHGLSVNASHCADYTASEYGLIMGLLSIMPEPEYQQGFNKQWSRKTKFDYFFPEFQCLSEQEIRQSEIRVGSNHVDNQEIFGYQGRYDEMRYKPNLTCGELRQGGDFDYYTMSRYFNNQVELNSSFIVCKPDLVGLFHDDSTNPFIINFGNIIKATRPILSMATPGMLDHF